MEMQTTLAIDGGATHTRAGHYDAAGALVAEYAGDACNPIVLGEERCLQVLAGLAAGIPPADRGTLHLCVAVSGANSTLLRDRIAEGLLRVTGAGTVTVADDAWPLLVANAGRKPAVLVIAGTGAVVLGQTGTGRWGRAGGRGPLLGDEGGGYSIAVAGLHAAAHAVDGLSAPSTLPDALVAAAGVDGFEALPAWCAKAGKDDMAGLATVILANAEQGDKAARNIVIDQTRALARHATAVTGRLNLPKTAPILMHGGLFEKSAYYRGVFFETLRALGTDRPTRPVAHRGHAAVFRFAALAEQLPPVIPREGEASPFSVGSRFREKT